MIFSKLLFNSIAFFANGQSIIEIVHRSQEARYLHTSSPGRYHNASCQSSYIQRTILTRLEAVFVQRKGGSFD